MCAKFPDLQKDILLFAKHEPILVLYIEKRYLKNNEDAKDIVKGIYLKFLKRRLLPIRNKVAWLRKVAKNDALKRLRKLSREESFPEGGEEALKDPSPIANEVLEKQDEIDHMLEVLYDLPIKQRDFIERYYLLGEDFDEIANALKIEKNSLYQCKRKSLISMRRLLKERVERVV